MRITLVALLWVVLVGGLLAFLALSRPAEPAPAPEPVAAGRAFVLEVVTSFAWQPDPFALEQGGALTVLLRGKALVRESGPRQPGVPFTVDVHGLRAGNNEFFLHAAPPLEAIGRAHAARLTLFRDERIVAQKSFWSETGEALDGTLIVALPGPNAEGIR